MILNLRFFFTGAAGEVGVWGGGVVWLDMDAAARSWAALATRPAVVRALNLGFGGGLAGMVAMQERDGGMLSGVE